MKKILKIMLSTFMLVVGIYSVQSNVMANDENDVEYVDINEKNAPDYYTIEQEEQRNQLISKLGIVNPILESNKTLNIIGYKQENNYYCGPASVKITLQYIKGGSLTQSQYASNMETDKLGQTYVYKITNELNRVLGSTKYAHILTSDLSLTSGFKYSIDEGYPLILHTNISKLPGYNGFTPSGHYVVGYKYNYHNVRNSLVFDITYWDPFDTGLGSYGSHTMTTSEMTNAINASSGYYIMRAQ